MKGPGPYNPALSQAAAEDAIQRVGDHADKAWMAAALIAVEQVARRLPRFTTDDIWPAIEPGYGTHEPRAMGAVMRMAAAELICRVMPYTHKSGRVVCHRRPLAIWQSLIYWRGIARLSKERRGTAGPA